MASFTPGPWEIRTDPTELSCKAISAQYEYEPREFASVWVAREVSEANARLIAAAPDLLAACEASLRAMGIHGPCKGNGCSECGRTWDAIKAAIAKAKV